MFELPSQWKPHVFLLLFTQFGETVLHEASIAGNTEIVKLLLQHDADVEARGNVSANKYVPRFALFVKVVMKDRDVMMNCGFERDIDAVFKT